MTRPPQPPAASSPRLQQLADEHRWWGDGAPTWTEAQGREWERQSSTAQEADARRERAAHLLHPHADDVLEALDIADSLENCTPQQPCMSGACPCCARAFQRWFVAAGQHLHANGLSNSRVQMVTAVPDYGKVALDGLDGFDLKACNNRLISDLVNARVHSAFGGVDLSLNVQASGSSEPYVQVQYTLFATTTSRTTLNKLKSALNRSKSIARPLMSKPFDGDLAGFAYAMKTTFVKRESYIEQLRNSASRQPYSNTRNRPLRGLPWAQLMAFLDRVGFDQRLILWRVKLAQTQGRLRLRLAAPA
jgi:hypothetical protein